ncbi:MAG: hypothetical protein JW395_3191 [Nitrospira sp.]|nr:hypothetical protein [Nitrospira sp.]
MVFQEIDDHPVFEHHPIRIRRGELDRLKRHLPGIAQRHLSCTSAERREQNRDDQQTDDRCATPYP